MPEDGSILIYSGGRGRWARGPVTIVDNRAPSNGQNFEWALTAVGATGGTFVLNVWREGVVIGETGPIDFDVDAAGIADRINTVLNGTPYDTVVIGSSGDPLPDGPAIVFFGIEADGYHEWTLQLAVDLLEGDVDFVLTMSDGETTDNHPTGTLWVDTAGDRLSVQTGVFGVEWTTTN